jgi:hypothetical protein
MIDDSSFSDVTLALNDSSTSVLPIIADLDYSTSPDSEKVEKADGYG